MIDDGWQKVRGVCFDVGGVLTTPLTPVFLQLAGSSGVDLAAVAPVMFSMFASSDDTNEPAHRLERGEITLEAFYELLGEVGPLARVLTDPASPSFAIPHLIAAPAMQAFVGEVRGSGRAVAVVSNVVTEWLPWWMAVLPEGDFADAIVLSCEVGLRKPNPAIYLLAAERLGLEPAEILFLDDFPAMVDAARGVGMQAIHVGGHDRAIAETRALLGL